jgi:biotin carboxyl carrier protein
VTKAEAEAAAPRGTSEVGQPLITQLPGLVLRIEKPVGSVIKVGETVLVIESMKMDNAIVSSVNGTIAEIFVKQGDQVQAGQELAMIR